MKIFVARNGKNLSASDEEAEQIISKLPQGEIIIVDIKRERNIKLLRRYWKLLTVIAENYSEPTTKKRLDHQIKIGTGYCDTFEANGILFHIPDSISFANMSEDEFQIFWEAAVHYSCETLIPNMKSEALEIEALRLTM